MQAFIDAFWNWATEQIPILGGLAITLIGGWVAKQQVLKAAAKTAALNAEKAVGAGHGDQKRELAHEALSKTWSGKVSTRKTISNILEADGMDAVKKASEPPPAPDTIRPGDGDD